MHRNFEDVYNNAFLQEGPPVPCVVNEVTLITVRGRLPARKTNGHLQGGSSRGHGGGGGRGGINLTFLGAAAHLNGGPLPVPGGVNFALPAPRAAAAAAPALPAPPAAAVAAPALALPQPAPAAAPGQLALPLPEAAAGPPAAPPAAPAHAAAPLPDPSAPPNGGAAPALRSLQAHESLPAPAAAGEAAPSGAAPPEQVMGVWREDAGAEEELLAALRSRPGAAKKRPAASAEGAEDSMECEAEGDDGDGAPVLRRPAARRGRPAAAPKTLAAAAAVEQTPTPKAHKQTLEDETLKDGTPKALAHKQTPTPKALAHKETPKDKTPALKSTAKAHKALCSEKATPPVKKHETAKTKNQKDESVKKHKAPKGQQKEKALKPTFAFQKKAWLS